MSDQDDIAAETVQLLAAVRQESLADVAKLIGQRFGGGCTVYLRSDVRKAFIPVAGYHQDPKVHARLGEFLGGTSSFTCRRLLMLLEAGSSLIMSGTPEQLDAWLDGSEYHYASRTGLRSLLAAPVYGRDGRIVAGLLLGRRGDTRFDRDDHDALLELTDSIADAIERERLTWELEARAAAAEHTARELFLAEQRFRAAFVNAPVALALFSLGPGGALLLETNAQLATMLGTTEDQLRGHASPISYAHPDDRPRLRKALARLLAGDEEVVTLEVRGTSSAGTGVVCSLSLSLVRDSAGEPQYGLVQIVDITDARRDQVRFERHARCQRALAAIGRRAVEEATWEGLAGTTLPALVEALATDFACVLSTTEERTLKVVAGSAGFELDRALPDTPVVLAARELPRAWLVRGARAALVAPIGLPSSTRTWLAVLSRGDEAYLGDDELAFVEAAAHLLGAAEERREAEAGARRRALLDPLTGLPNRTLFGDRVAHGVQRAAREGTALAVICLDVNRFTDVNETFGHAVGDELLGALSDRLDEALRANDSLARIGGDEFGVLCEDVGDERGALAVVRRIIRVLEAPVVLGPRTLHVTAGIGIAIGGGAAEGLLRDADTAMRRAKERSGTAYEVFDIAMRRRVIARLQLEQDLRRALDEGQLRLHYQPLVSLQERRIVGVEALVRWEHPERGMIPPAEFVPVAEETGLIVPLGTWVLDEACRQLAQWHSDPVIPPIYVSVNVSGRQLAVPGLADEVAHTLRRTGLDPGRLALELTESVLMAETSSPTAILQALHALGVKLLLDDFGTGYSSLNYVKRFPLHGLKVDRSFIAGLPQDEGDRAMLRAIVNMASALDIAVLAEGVETLEQASWLAGMDCDVAQGFGLARPAPADVIGGLLRDGIPAERLSWTLDPAPDHEERHGDGDGGGSEGEATIPLSEAAEALGVSASTLRRWADSERIEAIRTPGGHRRFPVSEVRRLSRQTTSRSRGTLRVVEFPLRPLPVFAELLEHGPNLVPAVTASVYRPGRPGWFANEAATGVLVQWVAALAGAARGGQYDGALDATQRMLSQADYAGAGLLERHQFLERARDAWLRELRERRASQSDLLDVRRLLVRLSHVVLESD